MKAFDKCLNLLNEWLTVIDVSKVTERFFWWKTTLAKAWNGELLGFMLIVIIGLSWMVECGFDNKIGSGGGRWMGSIERPFEI